MLSLIAAIKSLQPEQTNPLDVLAQAREIFAPAAANVDDFYRFEKFLSVADKIVGWRGGGGARSGWDVGLDYVREIGPSLLTVINNAMVLRMGGAGMAQPMPGTPPAAGAAAGSAAFDPYQSQAAMREYARRMNAQAAAGAPASPEGAPSSPAGASPAGAAPVNAAQGTPDGTSNEILMLINQYGLLVISALNGGMSGAYFADHISQLVGAGTVIAIANHGEDVLVKSMMSAPDLGMFGEARLRKFVYEFTHYEQILASEEEEDAPEPESDQPKRSRGDA